MMRSLIAIAALVTSVSAIAQTQVPNVFEDGKPAKAAEVNENFDALEATLPPSNCTTDQIIKWDGSAWVCSTPHKTYELWSGSTYVGKVGRFSADTWHSVPKWIQVFSDKGYTFNAGLTSTGSGYAYRVEGDNRFYYEEEDCAGQAYFGDYVKGSTFEDRSGVVWSIGDDLWFHTEDEATVKTAGDMLSKDTGTGCEPFDPDYVYEADHKYRPMFQNDPAITGFNFPIAPVPFPSSSFYIPNSKFKVSR